MAAIEHISIQDLVKLSARLTGHADAIVNAAAQHIADDIRLAVRCVDWVVATKLTLGDACDAIAKQLHEWRDEEFGDVTREEICDELGGAAADIERIVATEI
jgi:hypothetical protein